MFSRLFYTLVLVTVVTETGIFADDTHEDSTVFVSVKQRKLNARSGIVTLQQFLIGSRTSDFSAGVNNRNLPKNPDVPSGLSARVVGRSLPQYWDLSVGRRQELLEKAALLIADKSTENQAGKHTTEKQAGKHTTENGNDQMYKSESQKDLSAVSVKTKTYTVAEDVLPPVTGRFQELHADRLPADGQSSDALPADGLPADGLPSDGLPADGLPSDGLPSDGLPADGLPADGLPADGLPADGLPADGLPADGLPAIGKARTKVYRVEWKRILLGSLDGNFKAGYESGKSSQKTHPTYENLETVEGKSETLNIVGKGVPIDVLSDDGQVIQLIVSNNTRSEIERRNPERMTTMSAVYRVDGTRSNGQTHTLPRGMQNSLKVTENAFDHPAWKTPNRKTALKYRALLNPYWVRWTKALEALRKEQLARVTLKRGKNTHAEPPLQVTLEAKREYKE